jgi:hypothetical protein
MADAIVCPSCGKRFAFKPSLVGRRVNCPGCRHPFMVSAPSAPPAMDPPPIDDAFAVAEDEPIAPPPLPRASRATTVASVAQPVSYKSKANDSPANWTLGQKFALRLGTSLMVFGAAALILPLFGLQFRKLQAAGDNAQSIAIGLIVLGAVIDLAALAMRRLKMALMIVGGAIAAFVLLIVGLAFMFGHPRRPAFAPPPPMPSSPGGWSGAPPRYAPGSPTGSPSGSSFAPGPRVTHESLVEQFGEENVVKVNITMPDRKAARDGKFRIKVMGIFRSCGAKSSTITGPDNVMLCETAPIKDLDALAAAMTFGDATVDKATRTISVTFKSAGVEATTLPAQ